MSRVLRNAVLSSAALLAAAALTPAAAQNFNFGSALALNGRQVLIGQPANNYSPGLVYVYTLDAKGVWRQTTRIAAPDSAQADGFGRTLATDGNTLLVTRTASLNDPGSVHVYQRGAGGGWTHVSMIPGADSGSRFGRSLAVSGDLAFVGTTGADSSAGAVRVYRRSGTTWTLETTLRPDDPKAGNSFGGPIALAGDLLVVGASAADSGTGAAYVFRRTGTTWKQDARLTYPAAPPIAKGGRFGLSVLAAGNRIYVGAPGINQNIGAVVAFDHDSASGRWTPVATLLPFAAMPGTQFGASLAASGHEVWVGAPGANQFHGQVHRFTADTGALFTAVSTMASDSSDRTAFGLGIAINGPVAVVGQPFADNGQGFAALMSRTPAGAWHQHTVAAPVSRPTAVSGRDVSCTNGKASIFGCEKVTLQAFMPVEAVGGARGTHMNDLWGWTDPATNKEYALVGRTDGTGFIDVSNPNHPRYLGNLPRTKGTPTSAWRDIKVYHNYAYIVADGSPNHGVQIFDLTRLRKPAAAPQTFTEDAHYSNAGSIHNIVIDTLTGYAYLVGVSSGGETCGGGLHMVNIKNPTHPEFAGCFQDKSTGRASTGYTHDAQCTVYHGPDTRYTGREICFSANETAISIDDVTDKANPKVIGRSTYPNVGYTHQGWLTDDQRYFYSDDELDELQGKVKGTRTLVWDLQKLDEPVLATEYIAAIDATDHNLYIKGNRMYESNYVSGLRVIDISDRLKPKEVAFFDTVPVGAEEPGFGGSWSNYPFFRSGTIVVTSGSEGVFVLRDQDAAPIP
jgi:choice-of-anchor B domain-containing protein